MATMLNPATCLSMTLVPYKGGDAVLKGLMSGEYDSRSTPRP